MAAQSNVAQQAIIEMMKLRAITALLRELSKSPTNALSESFGSLIFPEAGTGRFMDSTPLLQTVHQLQG